MSITVDMGDITSAKAVIAINQSQRAMNSLLSHCLGHYDLTVAQWSLLGVLIDAPKTPTELAQELAIKRPYVAMLLRLLRERSFISEISSAHDTRSKRITITTEGKQFIDEVESRLQLCLNRELVTKIAPSDLETYFAVSSFIAKNVKHEMN